MSAHDDVRVLRFQRHLRADVPLQSSGDAATAGVRHRHHGLRRRRAALSLAPGRTAANGCSGDQYMVNLSIELSLVSNQSLIIEN